MNIRDFEKSLLGLVYQTNEKITPHFVAYRLGVPFAEAKQHLEQLATEGVISLEIGEEGALFYEVPGAERPKYSQPQVVVTPQPEVRRALAPVPGIAAGVFSVAGFFLFAALAFKLFLPLLVIALVFSGVKRFARIAHRSSCQHRFHRHPRF